MLAQAPVIGFVPVSDLAAAEVFYSKHLGLPVIARQGIALVLQGAAGTAIRCVLTPDARPQPFTILGWQVPDLTAAIQDLKAKKIQPVLYPHFNQDANGIWTAPSGDRIAWFQDPDGNVLSLAEHVTESKA